MKSDLSSAVHLHPSAEEEDHILQTTLLTRPHQSLRELVNILVKKAAHIHNNLTRYCNSDVEVDVKTVSAPCMYTPLSMLYNQIRAIITMGKSYKGKLSHTVCTCTHTDMIAI